MKINGVLVLLLLAILNSFLATGFGVGFLPGFILSLTSVFAGALVVFILFAVVIKNKPDEMMTLVMSYKKKKDNDE